MTMKELAKLAGVSPSAVSRYLNGGSLSPEKRAVIREAIEKTGYEPDMAAQALRTRTTDLIGIVVPRLDSEAVSRMAAGASDVLSREAYVCQFAVSGMDPEQELNQLRLFQTRSVAGVILMATVCTREHERFLHDLPIPAVVVGQKYRSVCSVYHDDYGAALELTRLVLRRGRSHPVYIGVTERDAAVGVSRRRGVEAGLREFGLDPEALPAALSDFSLESGREAMQRLLAEHPELDAVICATDHVAFGAMEALRAAGRRLPEDVSVVGVGDSWACSHISPHLTSSRFYYRASGQEAARMLVELLRSDAPVRPIRQTMLSYTIQLRDSI